MAATTVLRWYELSLQQFRNGEIRFLEILRSPDWKMGLAITPTVLIDYLRCWLIVYYWLTIDNSSWYEGDVTLRENIPNSGYPFSSLGNPTTWLKDKQTMLVEKGQIGYALGFAWDARALGCVGLKTLPFSHQLFPPSFLHSTTTTSSLLRATTSYLRLLDRKALLYIVSKNFPVHETDKPPSSSQHVPSNSTQLRAQSRIPSQ